MQKNQMRGGGVDEALRAGELNIWANGTPVIWRIGNVNTQVHRRFPKRALPWTHSLTHYNLAAP